MKTWIRTRSEWQRLVFVQNIILNMTFQVEENEENKIIS